MQRTLTNTSASILALMMAMGTFSLSAQKLITKTMVVDFYSTTPIEDIKAHLEDGLGIINTASNKAVFQVKIESFEFEKALMQEHFNENYLHSVRYPKAIFSVTIEGMEDWSNQGEHAVNLVGDMLVHGVTKSINVPATIAINQAVGMELTANFTIKPEDHGIEVPRLVVAKIAESIDIHVKATFK